MLKPDAFGSDWRVIDPGARCTAKIRQAEFTVRELAQLAVHRFDRRVVQDEIA